MRDKAEVPTIRPSQRTRKFIDSHLVEGAGTHYDRSLYSKDTFSNRIWVIERDLLAALIEDRPITDYLDFACGTGRVLQFMESRVTRPVGLDISPEMIREAKHKLRRSTLLQGDILDTGFDSGPLVGAQLITAFRFILNAGHELRLSVLRELGKYVSDNGRIVFNVHGNKTSVRFPYVLLYNVCKRMKLWFQRKNSELFFFHTHLSVAEIGSLVKEADLQTEMIYSYGFLPALVSRVLPRRLWLAIERRLVTQKYHFGTHLLVVCTKRPPS